jgi:hypothetical protein
MMQLNNLLPTILFFLALWLTSAQEPETADDPTALVFVPEYNIVECNKILKKRKCRREREACVWISSESLCKNREEPLSEHPGL